MGVRAWVRGRSAPEPGPGPLRLLLGVLQGLAIGVVTSVGFLAVSGQLGTLAHGAVLSLPPPGGPGDAFVRVAVAVGVTAAVLVVPLRWRERQPGVGPAVAALVLVVSAGLALVARDLVTVAMICLPAAVPALVLLVVVAHRSVHEPHRQPFGEPLPHLSAAVRVGAAYAVVAGAVLLL